MSITYRKPVIGITSWRRDLPTFLGERTDLYTIGEEYIRLIEDAGALVLILPHGKDEDVSLYMEKIDGLIVSGGGDVDPSSYNEVNTGLSYDVRHSADRFELALIKEAKRQNIPLLGICRGFQMLQVAFGGKLLQDIYGEYPNHPKYSGTADEILSQKHPVHLQKDCILAQIYDETTHSVNSIHHQCVIEVGEGFKAIGWSEDGIIEATQSTDEWFALGVQWHPEKLETDNEQRLFHFFVKVINQKNIMV